MLYKWKIKQIKTAMDAFKNVCVVKKNPMLDAIWTIDGVEIITADIIERNLASKLLYKSQ